MITIDSKVEILEKSITGFVREINRNYHYIYNGEGTYLGSYAEYELKELPDLPARGEPIPQTLEAYKRLSALYADKIEEDKAEIERLTKGIERLGSMEGFEYSFVIDKESVIGKEHISRIDYARALLTPPKVKE